MNFFAELRRRNVIRVAMAYLVLGWLLIQVGDVLFDLLGLPDWSLRLLAALLALGFLPTLFFAWAFELTPEGIRREANVDRSDSIKPRTGRKLDVATLGLLAVAIGLFVTEERWRGVEPGPASEAPIEASVSAPDSQAGAPVAPAEEAIPSVAVLPFANMSPDPDNAFFAEGISEEILNLLAAVDALSVASRTSAFVFRDRETPIPEIAAALKVRYVLEGSVRKAGEQVRITAQLIDAASDRHLWSNTFDRTLEDIFAVQDEIAAAIGDALQVELLGDGGQRELAESIDPDSYTEYLRARHLLRARTPESMREGNLLLVRIVAAAPGFARAHALLAEAYLLNRNLGGGNTDPLVSDEMASAQARMHASIARAIDPTVGGVELILGALAKDEAELTTALDHYARAIELEPDEARPYHWRGMLWNNVGFQGRAIEDLRKAQELDPLNPNVHFALADALRAAGELDAAEEAASRGLELGIPDGYRFFADIALRRGDPAAALAALGEIPADWGNDDDRRFLADMQRALRTGEPMDPSPERQNAAGEWLHFISAEDRLAWLAEQERHPFPSFGYFWGDIGREVRRDPRFVAFLDREGVLDLWREIGPPDDCRPDGASYRCGVERPAG